MGDGSNSVCVFLRILATIVESFVSTAKTRVRNDHFKVLWRRTQKKQNMRRVLFHNLVNRSLVLEREFFSMV